MATVSDTRYRKPDYRKKVERLLLDYPILKLAVDEVELPSCTPMYEERTSPAYSGYHSTTEKCAIRMADKKLQIKRIDRALEVLSIDEREMVELRYFKLSYPTDEIICEQLGWSKRSYYRVKARTLRKLALALNLI